MDRLTVRSLFLRALESGGRQISPFEVEWEVQGDCLLPVRREVSCRPHQSMFTEVWTDQAKQFLNVEDTFFSDFFGAKKIRHEYLKDKIPPFRVYLTVRCRMCDTCLDKRRRDWAIRAMSEIRRSHRTWFCTWTLAPEFQSLFHARAARRALRRTGEEIEALPLDEAFTHRVSAIGEEITKLFKRMRKEGNVFRYLVVAEAHKSGDPHFHVLLHEQAAPMRKAYLDTVWPFGYSQYRLVGQELKAAWYAAKYLGKTKAARVRASLGYGVFSASAIVKPRAEREPSSSNQHAEGPPSPLVELDHITNMGLSHV